MLRVTIFVGVIWILIRIITIVLLLDGKSGNWSPIHGAGHIMALIQVNLFQKVFLNFVRWKRSQFLNDNEMTFWWLLDDFWVTFGWLLDDFWMTFGRLWDDFWMTWLTCGWLLDNLIMTCGWVWNEFRSSDEFWKTSGWFGMKFEWLWYDFDDFDDYKMARMASGLVVDDFWIKFE